MDADPDYTFDAREIGRISGASLAFRCCSESVADRRHCTARSEARPFTDKQIELVTKFADQAVIAIENARLFDEVQAKTRELAEALVDQTGSGNILTVIASLPTDVGPVLKAIVESACGFATPMMPSCCRMATSLASARMMDLYRLFCEIWRLAGTWVPDERLSTGATPCARPVLRRRRRIP